LISGWGLAGEGMGKISKSRGGGPLPPMEMIERYSADAVRYWAASTSPGKDSVISEEKIQTGARLATKLWNVARFSQPFLSDAAPLRTDQLTPADRWILARLQSLIRQATAAFEHYEYANAKSEIENFFWKHLADNYLEMAKLRLYAEDSPARSAACATLREVLLTVLKLLAPIMPYVTEAIYRELFAPAENAPSIHHTRWPQVNPAFDSAQAEADGDLLVSIAATVRRYKSEHNLPLGSELSRVQLEKSGEQIAELLAAALPDLTSVTRARMIELVDHLDTTLQVCPMMDTDLKIAIGSLADLQS
jgi:valyl-tRNA synthetase